MKYVGSKLRMLNDGLGDFLEGSIARAQPTRIVDLFSGSSAVGGYLGTRMELPVLAVDSQSYAAAWGNATVAASRSNIDSARAILQDLRGRYETDERLARLSDTGSPTTLDELARARSAVVETARPTEYIFRAYGGHYFSPAHALALQIAAEAAQQDPLHQHALVAALCAGAVAVASSPGHMAQPLKSRNALPYIAAAWRRDFWGLAETYLSRQSASRPLVPGTFEQAEIQQTYEVRSSDWIFIDPPYSAIQYSRLYHVLEGIAVGGYPEVFGVGRMPPKADRIRSRYSFKSTALNSLRNLVSSLVGQGAHVVLTVPSLAGTNGIGSEALQVGLPVKNVLKFKLAHSSLGNGAHRTDAGESLLEFGY